MTRLVIDASVLVSAAVAFPDSHPSRLLDAVRAGQVEMIVCDQLLNEVQRALTTKYFARRINESERAEYLQLLDTLGSHHADPKSPPATLRDPGDDYLVALAAAVQAEAIVTGDRDLLDDADLEPTAMTARQACERLGLLDD